MAPGDEVRREDSGVPSGHRRHREVEADDRVHGEHQGRGQACQKQRGRLVADPVAGGAAPSHRQHSVHIFCKGHDRAVAQRAEVGDHSDVPEDHRDGGVGGDREDVPCQRRAELRPHIHGAGIRKEPVSQPGTANMDQREGARADHGEDGHGLGEAVDGVAPCLLEEKQDGGDQRASVADTDPPDEVDDGESPRAGDGDAPDAHALQKEPCESDDQQRGDAAGNREPAKPAERRIAGEHQAGDLLRHGLKGVSGRDHLILAGSRVEPGIVDGGFGRHTMQAPDLG